MRREKKRRIIKERREDEESLYYIVERDLDRDALFPGNDGWYSQVVTRSGRIDYVVKYGDKIFGLEIKQGPPSLEHFDQALKRYAKYVDGIFLAYPSDRAGEAYFLSESKQRGTDVGLLSIALYRTYCIRPAKFTRRESQVIWDNYFTLKRLDFLDKSERYGGTTLNVGGVYVSIDKDDFYGENAKTKVMKFNKTEWQSLAVLYALKEVKGPFKYHTLDELQKAKIDLGWGGYIDYSFLPLTGLIEKRMYGDCLLLFTISNALLVFEKKFKKAVEENIGEKEWQKLNEWIEKNRKNHISNQRKRLKEFLVK